MHFCCSYLSYLAEKKYHLESEDDDHGMGEDKDDQPDGEYERDEGGDTEHSSLNIALV